MDIVRPYLTAKSRVVIGTVNGDLHDIGKDIVAALLITAGFDAVDLGIDVHMSSFMDAARRNATDVWQCLHC
jgi:methanogenic corrinoid protein MtbC1